MKDLFDIPNTPHYSKELPGDEITDNYTRQVSGACFSYADSQKPSDPKIVHIASEFLSELELVAKEDKLLQVFSGAEVFNNFKSYAMCYGGHQFGNWAGQLGDGRAINIAEIDIKGLNWKLQLKGSGPTPYSRTADGFAVLRSSIREYLCSEAMYHLGVPTTRALSLITTGDTVVRDILYDGNPKGEKGAVVCRASPSFIRFGNFEIFMSKGDKKTLKQLVDYTIKHHYPDLGAPSKETYIAFFREVVMRTKEMIVHWQRVGFVHGVMNTDNMSILGLTIDYGPYGWLENYDPGWTPNTTDRQHKRYRFGNQPNIALWNLAKLANAIHLLIEETEPLQEIIDEYQEIYLKDYLKMMASKLGLYQMDKIDKEFIQTLTGRLELSEVDMTIFFRMLSDKEITNFDSFWDIIGTASYLEPVEYNEHQEVWKAWHADYVKLIKDESLDQKDRSAKMNLVNPKYVLRNYMAQLAIDEADKGNNDLVDELYQLLLKPYDEQPNSEKWFAKRPDWAKQKVGCSMLSCSS
ncbi:MAG: YdiU family protein [Flavobacteriales bacterium]|nr:YdiU family protein [Flavobacteriales bacterium]